MQEVEGAEARDMARTEALEDELADASSAREVLALALARLLRDTKARQVHPDDTANPVAALETQLNNLSVRDSKTSSPHECNDFIMSSLAVARKILATDPDVPVGALLYLKRVCSVPSSSVKCSCCGCSTGPLLQRFQCL